jgi:fermentation-respiration switch protein FrsA (DUF1100 family)
LLVVAVLVILVTVLWGFQRRLVYFPAGVPPPVEEVLPGASEVTIPTTDGLELAAWFLPSGPVGVAVLPGNAGNRAGRAPLAEALAQAGLSVLLVDYRGYGGNPGSPSEKGLMADGLAAASWLANRSDIERVVYYGESIGAAVAIGAAVERSPSALVLRSPFTSLPDVARVHFGPVPDWLLRDRFASIRQIDAVPAPVLVVAAEADEIVPIGQSRRLFEAALEPKTFVTIPGAGHNDPAMLDGQRLVEAVTAFLRRHGLLEPS